MKRGWFLAAGFAVAFGAKCVLDWCHMQNMLARVAWLHARQDRNDELWEMFMEDEVMPS